MLPQLLRELIIDQAIAPIKCTPEEEARASTVLRTISSLQRQTSGLAGGASMTAEQLEATRGLRIENSSKRLGVTAESYLLSRKDNWMVIYSPASY